MHRRRSDDRGAGRAIVVVGERRAQPGARLDEHGVPTEAEFVHAGGRDRDAVLVGLDLVGTPTTPSAQVLPSKISLTLSSRNTASMARPMIGATEIARSCRSVDPARVEACWCTAPVR